MTKKNNKQKKEKDNGIEIIPPEVNEKINIEPSKDDDSVDIQKGRVKVRKSGNLVVGNLNLALNPLKKMGRNYYQRNIWHLVANIFLLLLLILLLGFLILSNTGPSKEKIPLQPYCDNEKIIAGALNSFILDYQANKSLNESSLSVRLPKDFVLESVSPNNLFNPETNTFNLGNLKPGFNGQIKINGFVSGEVNDQQLISFHFNCNECPQDGISSTLSYNIDEMALEASVDINETIYLNNEFEVSTSLKNNSHNSFQDIKLNLGPEIDIVRSDLNVENGKLIIKEIKGKEKIDLNFWVVARKEGNIKVKPSFNFDLLSNNFSFEGQEKKVNVKIPGLHLSLLNDQKNIKKDEKINYTLNYENRKEQSIRDIKITLSSANPDFSLISASLLGELENGQIDDNTITIYNLLEGESASVDLSALFERRQVSPNQEIFLRADLEYKVGDQIIRHRVNSSKNKVISDISASAKAYYYSPRGDQLGVGPMPPAVDMATGYWIFLEFNNIGNELENFVLTAELPENVYFTGQKRVLDGSLIYGSISKKIVWEIENIRGGTNSHQASFELSLTPEKKDLGKIPNLLENIKITSKDVFTNENLTLKLDNVNTNLENDKLSTGQGRVINIR